MSFQEKSAWGLLFGLAGVSVFYFPAAFAVTNHTDSAWPLIALIVVGTVVLVIAECIYHAVIAVASPREANQVDERDRLIDLRAERNASYVLGFSLFSLVAWILLMNIARPEDSPAPLEIAVFIMLAISIAEIAKLASQIWFYRVGMR